MMYQNKSILIGVNIILLCGLSVLPRIKKWEDICPITSENEGIFSKP